MDLMRYAHEAAYCERLLAKSGLSVLTATLPASAAPSHWTHYPEGDVHDPDTGAHWYYHSHGKPLRASTGVGDTAAAAGAPAAIAREHGSLPGEEGVFPGEHGHFHCFVCPSGKGGPIHHLVALSVNNLGQLLGFFTVGRHVVNDVDIPAPERVALIERFDVQLARPDYLVNRWLTAVVALFQNEIGGLIHRGSQQAMFDPRLDVTASLQTTLAEKMQELSPS